MFSIILNIIVFILVLGIIIVIHELGHFFFAKKAGILCHEFSIGMGPAIYQKRKGETIYSIRGIPIGGYVSMAGESVSDALIKKDMTIGVKVNEQNQIYEIILNQVLPYDIVGTVLSFDLYGRNFNPLFIELEIDNKAVRYPVLRDAIYRLNHKQEMWITPAEKSFESKTLWQRFLVIFAGPFMNFVLALILFIIVSFFVTKPMLDSNEIFAVSPGSPAETIGLQAGDQLTAIDGQTIDDWNDLSVVMSGLDQAVVTLSYIRAGVLVVVPEVELTVIIQMAGITNVDENGQVYNTEPIIGSTGGRARSDGKIQSGDVITSLMIDNDTHVIESWDDVIAFFKIHKRGDLTLTYMRDGTEGVANYALISESALTKLGYQALIFQIGISPDSEFDWATTLKYPFVSIYNNTHQVFTTLGLLFNPSEKLGISDLAGPVGIFTLVSSTRSQGILALIGFTAFLSINIGLLNLLPIPALDGGRLIFLGIEALTRKPLNRKVENTINNVMFFMLLGLFVFVTYNDILRIFRG